MRKNYSLLFLFLLFFWTIFSVLCLGSDNLIISFTNYYLIFLLLYFCFRKYFAILFFIHALICSFCLPIGFTWGEINSGMIESIFRTNFSEAIEFTSQFPINLFIYSGLFFIISLVISYICWKNIDIGKQRTKNFILLFYSSSMIIIFFILCFDKQYNNVNIKNNLYSKIYTILVKKNKQLVEFEEILNGKNFFKVEKNKPKVIDAKPKHKNYFLVVGESMRNDYTSLYGYPIDTTPFLRQIKGKVYENFVAPSANTPTSLTRMFYFKNNQKLNILNNIITIAKSAGFYTIWISNHSQRGYIDVATTTIAKFSDDFYFFIQGDLKHIYKDKILDKNLLPILKDKIQENKNNQKINLYVLHLIGSHEPFCKRVDFEKEKLLYKSPDERLSCYLHSITKTDDFLRDLEKLLKEEFKEDYSVLYFSDHGLAHLKGEYLLRHHYGFKQNYESPLVIFNGDDTQQQRIKVKKSGYNFIFAFAEWLGIREKNLEAENYTFFNNEDDKNIKVYNWDKDVDFDSLPRDIRFVEGVEKLNP